MFKLLLKVNGQNPNALEVNIILFMEQMTLEHDYCMSLRDAALRHSGALS